MDCSVGSTGMDDDVFLKYLDNAFLRAAFFNLSEMGQRLTDEELGYSFYGNRLIGVPRLRQLRVRKNKCSNTYLSKVFNRCFGHYSAETQSTDKYGNQTGYAMLLSP